MSLKSLLQALLARRQVVVVPPGLYRLLKPDEKEHLRRSFTDTGKSFVAKP